MTNFRRRLFCCSCCCCSVNGGPKRLICVHPTKTKRPEGNSKLRARQMLWSQRDVRRWWSESSVALAPTALGLSLPGIEDSPSSPLHAFPSQDPQRPHLCSPVPRLLAFLPGPLSNSRGEADGPGFLCTNQGGICSLADTSPLTRVSGRIHYSSWVRWAAVRVHNKAEAVLAMKGRVGMQGVQVFPLPCCVCVNNRVRKVGVFFGTLKPCSVHARPLVGDVAIINYYYDYCIAYSTKIKQNQTEN